jgi:hypothetical protein
MHTHRMGSTGLSLRRTPPSPPPSPRTLPRTLAANKLRMPVPHPTSKTTFPEKRWALRMMEFMYVLVRTCVYLFF